MPGLLPSALVPLGMALRSFGHPQLPEAAHIKLLPHTPERSMEAPEGMTRHQYLESKFVSDTPTHQLVDLFDQNCVT